MSQAPPRQGRAALWCCLGAGFATLLDSAVVNFTVPALRGSVPAGTAGIQWYLAAYSLTFGLGLVPAGRIGDAYGRTRPFVLGMSLFLLGALLSATGPGIGWVVAGRLAQGFGAGFVSAQVLGIIQDRFTGTDRLRALAGYTSAGALAAIVGPLLAGLVLGSAPPELAWRLILLLPVPFALAVIVLAVLTLPAGPRVRRSLDLDLAGITVLGVIVVVVMLPLIDPGLPVRWTVSIGVLVVLLVLALTRWERRYARAGRLPLFAPELLRERGYVNGNVVALLWFGTVLGLSTALTIFFLGREEVGPMTLALALVPASLARMASSAASRRAFARWGPSVVARGLVLQGLCILVLLVAATVLEGTGLFVVAAVVLAVLGVSGGLIEPTMRVVTLEHAPERLRGVAAAFLQLTQRLSATVFVALATGIVLSGGLSVSGLQVVLVVSLATTGVALMVAARPVHPRPGHPRRSRRARARHAIRPAVVDGAHCR